MEKFFNKSLFKFFSILLLILIMFTIPTNTYALSGDDLGFSMSAGKMGTTTKNGVTNLPSHSSASKTKMTDSLSTKETGSTFYSKIFSNARTIIFALSGIGTLTSVLMFVINFIRLGVAENNPTAKAQAAKGLMHTGIAAALLGGVTLLVGISYNFIK